MSSWQSDVLDLTGGVLARESAPTMARPIRIQYPDAVYHEIAPGSHGPEIFQDDQDRQRFLETLGEAKSRDSPASLARSQDSDLY